MQQKSIFDFLLKLGFFGRGGSVSKVKTTSIYLVYFSVNDGGCLESLKGADSCSFDFESAKPPLSKSSLSDG